MRPTFTAIRSFLIVIAALGVAAIAEALMH